MHSNMEIKTDSHKNWIKERLDELGAIVVETEQISKHAYSVIIKITTEAGQFYFKESDVSEASVASIIAREKPGFSPDVLGVDKEKGWLLTRSGGNRLIESGDVNHWLLAGRMLGGFHQQMSVSHFQSSLKTTSFYYSNLNNAFNEFLSNKEW